LRGYGATLKNYCITLVTAICGLAVTLNRPGITLLSMLPIVTFSLMDAQYLKTERRLRALFEMERLEDWRTLPMFDIKIDKAPAEKLTTVLVSWSILSFYIPLALGVAATFIFLGKCHE
jgi:hypothetical protein